MKLLVFQNFFLSSVFLWLIFQYSFSQNPSENKNTDSPTNIWSRVDVLLNEGRYKSAMPLVLDALEMARKKNQGPTLVKAYFYLFKCKEEITEDTFIEFVREIDQEIGRSASPLKEILYSIRGQLLWTYYIHNAWQINNRKLTQKSSETDFRFWDANQFAGEIQKSVLLSIKNSNILKSIPLSRWVEIVGGTPELRYVYPTLYDFLAHRAVDYLSQSRLPSQSEESLEEYLNRSDLWTQAETFAHTKELNRDSLSFIFSALEILKDLTIFHLNRNDLNALTEVDLKRFNLLNTHSRAENKNDLLKSGLEKIVASRINTPHVTEAAYQLARWYYSEGSYWKPSYQKPLDSLAFYFKLAVEICARAEKAFPKSPGAYRCRQLSKQITQSHIQAIIPKLNPANKPILTALQFKNINTAHIQIFEADYRAYENFTAKESVYDRNKILGFIKSQSLIHQENQILPNNSLYHSHITYVKLPPLKPGFYLAIFSEGNGDYINNKNRNFCVVPFHSSDITFFHETQGNELKLKIYHSATDKPQANVLVRIFEREYDFQKRKYSRLLILEDKTNEKGEFLFKSTDSKRHTYIFEIFFENQIISSGEYIYLSPYIKKEDFNPQTIFFTDRSIYRPGQIVQFKGIMINGKPKPEVDILTDYNCEVLVKDPNGRIIFQNTYKTNDFGSFWGSINLPIQGITGRYTIKAGNSTYFFNVEEYKRPRFEMALQLPDQLFYPGDTIVAEGRCLTLAGYPVSGALIKYKVQRQIYQKRGFYREIEPPVPDWQGEILVSGIEKPGTDGRFFIRFPAKPNLKFRFDSSLTYAFNIYAECTDLTGETRNISTTALVSYTPVLAEISCDEVLFRNQTSRPKISLFSVQGKPTESYVKLKIRRLISKNRVVTPSLLPSADIRLIPQAEFLKEFPNHLNAGETPDSLFADGPLVLDTIFLIKGEFSISAKTLDGLPNGYYKMEVFTHPGKGKSHTSQRKFVLTNENGGRYEGIPIIYVAALSQEITPGQKIKLRLASLSPTDLLIEKINEMPSAHEQKVVSVKNDFTILELPTNAQEIPGIRLRFTSCILGRILSQEIVVRIQDPDKNLDIQWLNVPDTIEPGKEYTWKFRISTTTGKITPPAEVAAVMYDAALDKLLPSNWQFRIPEKGLPDTRTTYWSEKIFYGFLHSADYRPERIPEFYYPFLKTFGFYLQDFKNHDFGEDDYFIDGVAVARDRLELKSVDIVTGGVPKKGFKKFSLNDNEIQEGYESEREGKLVNKVEEANFAGRSSENIIHFRGQFQETAFFIPSLITEGRDEGEIKFQAPEQLSGWIIRLAGHSKSLSFGLREKKVFSQKKLMVTCFAPRFLIQNDNLRLTAKVTNLSGIDRKVFAFLEILNGQSNQLIERINSNKPLEIKNGNTFQLGWNFSVPSDVQVIKLKIGASGQELSDGEELLIPVLPNEVLLTESLPFHVRAEGKLHFEIPRLKEWQTGVGGQIKPVKLVVEATENPIWLVVQTLPYLADFPHECSEQLFARFFAQSVVRHLTTAYPRIKVIIEYWNTFQPEALMSALERNTDLKNILIEETPWWNEAQDESVRKKHLALWIKDLLHTDAAEGTARKILQRQMPDGGWSWFPGGPGSWYITQHILSGIGKMEKLNILKPGQHVLAPAIPRAVKFLDWCVNEDFKLNKKKLLKPNAENHWMQPIHAHYLYVRSFFEDIKPEPRNKEAIEFFENRAKQEWNKQTPYIQAMLAIWANRKQLPDLKNKIITALRERSIQSEDYGMYWKGMMQSGYHWSEHPIETMALMMECFRDCGGSPAEIAQMQIWLLRHKQSNQWKSTKATTDACLALLQTGPGSENHTGLNIFLGGQNVTHLPAHEAGTGYFRIDYSPTNIPTKAYDINVEGGKSLISWGSVYFQYFSPYDKVEASEGKQLTINRELLREVFPGKPLRPVSDGDSLKVGQRVFVRLRVTCSQPMEFIHIKDRRSATFEPEDVLSGYLWSEGLGFYMSTRDVATHFFIDYLPRGTFVLEYPVRVTHEGDFSDGFAEIQCMYAPEFGARTVSKRCISGG